jgi:uncharacterized protein YjiS (DUF1127 family)
MTTYDLHHVTDDRRMFPDVVAGFTRLIATLKRHHRRRITLRSIAHLDALQLQDIGLDPADVADAMDGDGEVLWSKIPGCR